MQQRILGFQLRFLDTSLQGVLSQKKLIIDSLKAHGCICLKGLNFQPKDMVNFTKGLTKQVIQLPPQMSFNNLDNVYKQIARVGNINLDGSLKNNYTDAAYWHQDGNFWGPEDKRIINCLHSKEEPETGGQTWVMDLVKGYHFLKQNKPDLFKILGDTIAKVDLYKIEDFKKVQKGAQKVNTNPVSLHQVLMKAPLTQQDCLFLSAYEFIQKSTQKVREDWTPKAVINLLASQMGHYSHKWTNGDILIWDNTQVIHRSSGMFSGRRLLYRCQGRFNENDYK